jgi:hypothetical protein
MQPFPQPNSVIIMDNARIHKDPRVLDLILDRLVDHLFFIFSLAHIQSLNIEECGICFCHHTLLITTLLNLPSHPLKLLYGVQANLEGMTLILMSMTLMFMSTCSLPLIQSHPTMQQSIMIIVVI